MELDLYIPKLDDLWFYQQMMADPATMSYNIGYDPWPGYHQDTGCIDFPREEWEAWYAQWVGREPERFYAYIRRRSDGEWIGDINFHHTPDKDWWDMGIVIFAPCRGQGYAAPALRLMVDHAFRVCGVSRLHNYFETTREAAWKAHLAAGFRDAGTVDGIRHLLLTREEYLTAQGG